MRLNYLFYVSLTVWMTVTWSHMLEAQVAAAHDFLTQP